MGILPGYLVGGGSIMADVVLFFPKSSFIEAAMKHQYPPTALLSLAVHLDSRYRVKIIDQRTDSQWKRHLQQELKKGPICVGFSSYTGEQINFALEATRYVKNNSDVPVVWGGVHPTILPRQTLENRSIDFVVKGEGEETFPELVMALEKQKNISGVRGVLYKRNGTIKENAPRPPIDLNNLPELPYHLVDMRKYIVRFNNRRVLSFEASRGCVNRCAFCFIQNLGQQRLWRALTPERTIERIRDLKERFHVEGIEFQDYNFFVDLARSKRIMQLMLKEKLDVFWMACARINNVMRMDRSYLRLIEKSGNTRFALGVESGSDRILRLIKKDITVKQVLAASKKLSRTKIPPFYSLMQGFPTETEAELRMTVGLALRLLRENSRAKISIIHCYRPLPGNELFDLCVNHGLKAPSSLEEWGKYDMTAVGFPWLSQKRRKQVRAINFLSLFVDRKFEEVESKTVWAFSAMYRPIALRRLKKFNFSLMLAPTLKDLYVRVKQ